MAGGAHYEARIVWESRKRGLPSCDDIQSGVSPSWRDVEGAVIGNEPLPVGREGRRACTIRPLPRRKMIFSNRVRDLDQ